MAGENRCASVPQPSLLPANASRLSQLSMSQPLLDVEQHFADVGKVARMDAECGSGEIVPTHCQRP